jgi:hypothetical protein
MSINKKGKQFINSLYDHYNIDGKWIGSNSIRKQFGPKIVDKLERKYDPKYFIRWSQDELDHYELTIRGIKACSNSDKDIKLINEFFSYLREVYSANPDIKTIAFTKVFEDMDLGIEEIDRLHFLISILQNSHCDNNASLKWIYNIPYDFEKYATEEMSVDDYVDYLIETRYKYDKTWRKRSRFPFYKDKLFLWILIVTQSWSAVFILLNYFPTIFGPLVTVCLYITIFSFTQILHLFGVDNSFISPKEFLKKLFWNFVFLLISFLITFISGAYHK